MKNLNEMNKAELRAACKEAGVKGYGNMTNDQMREAVAATQAPVVSEGDKAFIAECGHANCPHCGVHLSNGMWNVDALVSDKRSSGLADYARDASKINQEAKFSFWCMGCDEYFGEARVPMDLSPKKVAAPVGTGIKIEKNRATQNGITRPSNGGVCAQIWEFCDKCFAEGVTPTLKLMKAQAAISEWDQVTTSVQYYQWRKFQGITGRI